MCVLCAATAQSLAQEGTLPWQEYSRLVEQGREVAPLNIDDMFGERVDLYSGALSFSATDLSIPGNNALPVAVTRKLQVHDRDNYGINGRRHAFADWDIDIPNVSGVFSTTWHDNRCSQATPPMIQRVMPDEYWAGNHADLPGGGEMLRDSSRPAPSTGGPYLWITEGDTYFSCLPGIRNGSGQGFLALDKEGNRYWLDHMAQYNEPRYVSVERGASPERLSIARRRNVLYASRVEDRFGNWVSYTYSNAYDQPVRLTSISSSDGRSVALQYNAEGYVASVAAGSRTWTYAYSGNNLASVALPDGSSWSFNLSGLSDAVMWKANDPNDMRSCFDLDQILSGDVSGSITHPSGATATFVVGPQQVGRSNVPGVCRNFQLPGSPGNDTRDDFPVFPVEWVSLVIKSKHVQGPGLAAGAWSYGLASASSWQYPAGATQPICSSTSCAEPVCLSDACSGYRAMLITGPAGSWERYTFGNSYRYNEGKLLTHEVGGSGGPALKTTVHSYNYATSGQPYAARIGSSPQPRGAGFLSEYPRPLVKTEIIQDGTLFQWAVATGCAAAGVHCFDGFARPIQVVRTGVPSGVGTGGPTVPPASAPSLTAPPSSATGSYALVWTEIPLATGYELQEHAGSGAWATIQFDPATSAQIGNRSSGSWSYRVRACNVNGCSSWSATGLVSVVIPPGTPTLSTPATNATGSFTVTWSAMPEASRYELEHRRNGGAWSRIHDGPATSANLSAQPSGTHDFRVRACNAGGCSADSALSSTVVTLVTLGVPNLTAPTSVRQDRPFTVSWTAVAGAAQYILEYNHNGGAYWQAYAGAALSVSQVQAMQGNYVYRVRACDANGCGANSTPRSVLVTVGP